MPAANGIYKLAVIGTVNGQQHVHTLHFRSTADPDSLLMSEDAYMGALVDEWQTGCRTAYRGIFYTWASPVQQYQVRKVCGGTPLPAGIDEAETTGNILGTLSPPTVGADSVSSWLANVVTERTALAGRRYRGRFFLGGMCKDNISDSVIQASRLTPTQAYADALKTVFIDPADVDLPFSLFVFSRVQSLVAGTPCQNAGADVRSLQVRNTLASMKSRKAGSGV